MNKPPHLERPSRCEAQVNTLHQSGGFSSLKNIGLITVSGADAAKFLQFRTTNDVGSLNDGQGQSTAILDRTAHVMGLFSLHRTGNCFYLLCEKINIKTIIDELEKYHFKEDIVITDCSTYGEFWTVQGPLSYKMIAPEILRSKLQAENDIASIKIENESIITINKAISASMGFIFWIPNDRSFLIDSLQKQAKELAFTEVSADALETVRIEYGIPIYGIDITADELLPDTGLEQSAASYTKGCYLGQEVIARIKTYSAPRKGLVGLIFEENPSLILPLNAKISLAGKIIGVLKSSTYSSHLNATIAFAYLSREHRTPGRTLNLEIDKTHYSCRTAMLPFFSTHQNKEKAQALYEEGLKEFANGDENKSIQLLRQSLDLDPSKADTYETLGVVLSRHEQLDEAIELMNKLAKLDPNSAMAHTNLSIFYMQKGDKDAAENEKAIAMSIRMSQIAKEVNSTKQAEVEKAQKIKEATERLDMYKEVLAIDNEDFLANWGLGNILVEIEKYEEAVPHLQKTIAVKPTHSVAYLSLGKALTQLNKLKDATDVYEKGIEVAAQKGDMTPLKQMQELLTQLKTHNNL